MTTAAKASLSLPTLTHSPMRWRFVSRQGPRLVFAIMVALVCGLLATIVYGPVSVAAAAHVSAPTSRAHERSLELISNARRARLVVTGDSVLMRVPIQPDSFVVLTGRVLAVSGVHACDRSDDSKPFRLTVDVGSGSIHIIESAVRDSAVKLIWRGSAVLRLFDRTLRSRIACLTSIAR